MIHLFLSDHHTKLGVKWTQFSGYQMPLWYGGIAKEHRAVRLTSGIFDISHMGIFRWPIEVLPYIQYLFTNSLAKNPGKMVYGMILSERGTILDDVMIGVFNNEILMITNAGNTPKISSWITEHTPLLAENLNSTHCLLALQGPDAIHHLERELTTTAPPRMGIWTFSINGHPIVGSRTGYTGADGVELIVPNTIAPQIWDQLVSAGVVPCGLGARDTLRIEAGLPLYGHELSETVTPLITRYPWVIANDHEFIGQSALINSDSPLTTVGFEMIDKVIPRHGYPLQPGTIVTSGTQSPLTGKSIGMGFVNKTHAKIGSELSIQIRNTWHRAIVVKVPFQ